MSTQSATRNAVTLFLSGDVMTGRGVDQILPHPSAPQLYEPYVSSAYEYVAHRLIDVAGVDIVHGHSSHHPKPIEVYQGKLILYGCGDLLNDYEGIRGYERFRSELGLMYFPEIDRETGDLVRLTMTATCIRRLQVNLADRGDAGWLSAALSRECRPFGTSLRLLPDGSLALERMQAVRESA